MFKASVFGTKAADGEYQNACRSKRHSKLECQPEVTRSFCTNKTIQLLLLNARPHQLQVAATVAVDCDSRRDGKFPYLPAETQPSVAGCNVV